MNRIKGIDSIRFVCALAVLIGHYGVPLPASLQSNDLQGINKILSGVAGCAFNGPAAVVVFFIISGFCIHYPFKNGQKMNLASYYTKRLLRISIPAIIAIGIYKFAGLTIKGPEYVVMWSIICEVIYYLIYPLLLIIKKSISWSRLVGVAYACAFALIISNLEDLRNASNGYVALGLATWIIGLPCWLLGCWLAENYSRFPLLSTTQIWSVRLGVYFITFLLRVTKFHVDSILASNCITLSIFALIACIWIGLEIAYYLKNEPSQSLEWAGQWSYSLYIIHPAVPSLFAIAHLAALSQSKLAMIIAALVLSYIFYLLVERPTHRIAVAVSKKIKALQEVKTEHVLP